MPAEIKAIEYQLPTRTESVTDLASCFPGWSEDHVLDKTGIRTRHIAADDECASDLGLWAAQQLFANHDIAPEDVDFLLFCTQTPDYLLPSTACLVQHRLGLGNHVGALDINLGCSGYIYALGVAKALLETGQARRLLLITADTYSKLVHPGDRGTRAIFGDGATATLLAHGAASQASSIGPFVYGTDGSGAQSLLVPSSGMRQRPTETIRQPYTDQRGNTRSEQHLFMDGRAVVQFTLREVPAAMRKLCDKAGISLDDVDAVVPHQASALVLEGLRKEVGLPPERFITQMEATGNTVSSSIPLALWQARQAGQVKPGSLLLLVGFGVGLSWAATLVRLPNEFAVPAVPNEQAKTTQKENYLEES